MEIKTDNCWATPIWKSRIESVNNKDLIRFVLDERARAPEIIEKSNRGGWQSRTSLFGDTEMGELCEKIWAVCFELWPFIEGIEFKQMWAAINKINDWNMIHQHGQYEISGGYYLRVPEDSGKIVFRDPNAIRSNRFINRFIIGGELEFYQPKEHDLMMWPAYLDHFVEPSKSNEDRIMISFDLDINKPEIAHKSTDIKYG